MWYSDDGKISQKTINNSKKPHEVICLPPCVRNSIRTKKGGTIHFIIEFRYIFSAFLFKKLNRFEFASFKAVFQLSTLIFDYLGIKEANKLFNLNYRIKVSKIVYIQVKYTFEFNPNLFEA